MRQTDDDADNQVVMPMPWSFRYFAHSLVFNYYSFSKMIIFLRQRSFLAVLFIFTIKRRVRSWFNGNQFWLTEWFCACGSGPADCFDFTVQLDRDLSNGFCRFPTSTLNEELTDGESYEVTPRRARMVKIVSHSFVLHFSYHFNSSLLPSLLIFLHVTISC